MAVRILHIITQLELGGAQKNVLSILSLLSPDQYEIHLITSEGLLSEEARRIPNLKVVFLPFFRRPPNPIFDLLTFFILVFYIKWKKIDIVHTHSSKAGILGRWAAKFANVRIIVHSIHGWGFHDYLKSFFNDFYIYLEKITAKITTRLIAVTESDIHKGLKHGIGSPDQYILIRYGIDTNAFLKMSTEERELRRSLGLRQEKVVGMVACLKPQKNPLDFIKGAELISERNPQTKFLIVGDGVLRPMVEREIKKRGLQEHCLLLGWRKDISAILPILDVLVLTSLWEGLPLVFLEAMNFSKPIVAYDICGLAEVIKDGVNGFLVNPRDIMALSKKVGLLLNNDELRDRMGRFAHHIVSNEIFTSHAMGQSIEHLYAQLGTHPFKSMRG